MRRLHDLVHLLRIDSNRFSWCETPQNKIDVVRSLHRGGRKLDAASDFMAQIARDVPADQRADGLADRAVVDRAFYISKLGIESLRIPDREQQGFRSRQRD